MAATSEGAESAKELRASLEDLYGDNLVGIRLFGSYARRQATPDSDVDVLRVLREIGDYGTEVRRVSDLLSRVSLEYGKTIAPIFVDAKRFLRRQTRSWRTSRARQSTRERR